MIVDNKNHIDLKKFLRNNPDIRTIKCGNEIYYQAKKSPYYVTLPHSFSHNFCRFVGILLGDGNFSDEDDKRILITDKCKEYHKNVIIPLAKYLFNLDFNLYPDGNRNSYYSHKKSSVLYRFFIPSLGFRPGSVRKQIINEIPEYLYDLDVYQKAHVIAGLFDAESKVSLKQAQIDFSISSRPIWEYIYQFLDYVGIKYSLPGRREGRRPSGEYEICITGRYNIEIFLDFVPMKHPEKIKRLKKFIPLTRC